MIHKFLRLVLCLLSLTLLLSCGGGSDVSGGSNGAAGTGMGASAAAGSDFGGDGPPGSGSDSAGGGDGSTSTAANGSDDGSGVGSGGTGATAADAGTSVGAVDGMGSIFVSGLRYDVDQAAFDLRDASDLQVGMTVAVTGPVDAAFANGTARHVRSMAQMRGPVGAVDVANDSFQLLGSTIGVDENTVWANLGGLAGLIAGAPVQVWALPVSPGLLRATRIESNATAAAPLATGMVSQLDTGNRSFQLGTLVVNYGAAGLPPGALANGRIVRVTASGPPVAGRIVANQVEDGYALSAVKSAPVQLEGIITDFAASGSFKLMGVPIDATAAQVTGGQPDKLGNAVTVVAAGTLSDAGVLVASKLKIQHIPGGGALHLFNFIGPITDFVSLSDMVVRNQRMDASAATIVGNGQLANGVRISVQGTEVVNNVLKVTQLAFVQ